MFRAKQETAIGKFLDRVEFRVYAVATYALALVGAGLIAWLATGHFFETLVSVLKAHIEVSKFVAQICSYIGLFGFFFLPLILLSALIDYRTALRYVGHYKQNEPAEAVVI